MKSIGNTTAKVPTPFGQRQQQEKEKATNDKYINGNNIICNS